MSCEFHRPDIPNENNILKMQKIFLSSSDESDQPEKIYSHTLRKRNRKPTQYQDKKKNVKSYKHNISLKTFVKDAKLIQKIFSYFKSQTQNLNEFPLLTKIEKKVKSKSYQLHTNFAKEIRATFNFYFNEITNEPQKYIKLFSLSEAFESAYKDYDNKNFVKESKNLIDIKKRLNKIKKAVREACTENQVVSANKQKINYTEQKEKKSSLRNFKMGIAKSIHLLSQEQKKGIVGIINSNYIDKSNYDNSVMEFDINKMSFGQLKQLEKYINKCQNENSSTDMASQNSFNELGLTKKQSEIIEDDELSESLSSDSSNMSLEEC